MASCYLPGPAYPQVLSDLDKRCSQSGMIKDFFDRTYYAVLDRIVGRPYATLICAGSDGENDVRQIQRIAIGNRELELECG
jgi:hypothetical protein